MCKTLMLEQIRVGEMSSLVCVCRMRRRRRSPSHAAFSQRSFVGLVGYAQCRSSGARNGEQRRSNAMAEREAVCPVEKQRCPAPFGSV